MSPKREPTRAKPDIAEHARLLAERRRRRGRRRLVALAAALALGLALGTIWATGFAVSGGVTGTAAESNPILTNPPDSQDTSGLNANISSSGNLTWHWQGQWGYVDSQAMYTVDLESFATGEKFFVGVYLATIPTGFADLQLQLRIKDNGSVDTCGPSDIEGVTNTDDYRIFTFESNDAQVTFSGMNGATTGLPGGSNYCIGVANYDGSGKDPDGTFIRKDTTGSQFTGQYPTFVASLNRMD